MGGRAAGDDTALLIYAAHQCSAAAAPFAASIERVNLFSCCALVSTSRRSVINLSAKTFFVRLQCRQVLYRECEPIERSPVYFGIQ
jgi:hypothetical protein